MVSVSSQLDRWTGEFGREYTDRNLVEWSSRVDGFRRMIPPKVKSVFEVGVNRGHNLRAIRQLNVPLVQGCEPSLYPREFAAKDNAGVCVCSVYDLNEWHNAASFDLVFTSGVLIHIPPEQLDEALTQIHRLASKYVLAIEYDSQEDTAIEYRGQTDMLWKRNYGKHYTRLFPDLKLVDVGQASAGFDRATYWLLEK